MSKSTVSIEKKIEIANYCLAHECNYLETANKFEVSYQNVYAWTKKYASISKEEQNTDIKENDLEAQLVEKDRRIHLLEMENDYLKKLAQAIKKDKKAIRV